MVRYAPVSIGGSSYLCPVKGVAIFKGTLRDIYSMIGPAAHLPLITQIDDISFTDYHLFRTEMRILTGENGKP